MASTLPDNPSLDEVCGQACALQQQASAADPVGSEFVRRHHPDPDRVLAGPRLDLPDAQLSIARHYGFSSWPALLRYLDVAAELGVDPSRVDEAALDDADRFCALSVLRYTETDAPPRRLAAAALLDERPRLVDRHVWAAAAAGDPDAVRAHLAGDPALSTAAGGPFGWTALMYLCYSRVELRGTPDDALTAATLLLEAGADPNAGYLWRGMSTPFTALTGVFGEGEQGPRRQPRHPIDRELASLLLAAGAHPVDQQALYNRMFRPDDSHLELLFAHGLSDAGPSPWETRLGEAMPTRAQMWQGQIAWAAGHGYADRLRLLSSNGIDVSGVEVVAPVTPEHPNARDGQGATALHHAAWDGDLPRIRELLDAGADPTLTDTRFNTTAQGWAEHAYQSEAAELLRAAAVPPLRE